MDTEKEPLLGIEGIHCLDNKIAVLFFSLYVLSSVGLDPDSDPFHVVIVLRISQHWRSDPSATFDELKIGSRSYTTPSYPDPNNNTPYKVLGKVADPFFF